MKPFLIFIFLPLFCIVPLSLYAQAIPSPNEDIKQIIGKMDRLYRADQSYVEIDMEIVNPNWKRVVSMTAWSEGMNKTFIRITSPEKDKGIATLRVGREMWNYFPKIDKVMKIPPSMMMSSWMGSDFTNDDLVKQTTFLDDYDARLLPAGESEKGSYLIELKPKEMTASVWGKVLAKIRVHDYLPVWEEYFDEKGTKMRVLEFTEIKMLGGRMLPSVLSVTPLNKKGNRTIIKYKFIDFAKGAAEGIFTLRNLQKRM